MEDTQQYHRKMLIKKTKYHNQKVSLLKLLMLLLYSLACQLYLVHTYNYTMIT